MVKFKINKNLIILTLFFGLFLVFVPKTHGQAIESAPWQTQVGNPTGPPPGAGATGDFVYYYQADPRWNDACHYNWAICGPTSIAMIMSSFGDVVTPDQTDTIANQSSPPIRYCGDSAWTGTTGWNRYFQTSFFTGAGFIATPLTVPLNLTEAKTFIDTGYLILASVSIHIFVIDDVNPATGQVHLRDPARNSPSGYWSPASAPWTGASGTSYAMTYAYAITRR